VEEAFTEGKYVIIYGCRNDGIKRQGVGIVVSKKLSATMSSYKIVSERLVSIKLEFDDGPVTIFSACAPDSNYDDEVVDDFYNQPSRCSS